MFIKKILLPLLLSSGCSCVASLQKNTFIAFISGFNLPLDMAITSNNLYGYVTDNGSNSVLVIDTNPASATFNSLISAPNLVGVFNHPVGLAITPNNKFVYVADENSSSVLVIDSNPSSPTFNHLISAPALVGAFADPIGVAIPANGLYAYVINGNGSNTVNVIDINPASSTYNTVLSTPALDTILASPFSIVISPDGKYGYVSNLSGSMTVIDTNPSSSTFNTVILAPGLSSVNAQPEGFDITPNGQFAYVSDGSNGDVTFINTNPRSTSFNTVLSAPNLASAFFAPNDVTVLADGSAAYVSNFLGSTGSISNVSVIDTNPTSATYNSTLNTPGLTLVGTTRFLSVTAAPNGLYVYALDGFNNTVDVIYTGLISVPRNVTGCKTINKFLFESDYINRISWAAPIVGLRPISYKIYRDSRLTQLVTTIPATESLQYIDHNRSPLVNDTYYIVSVDNTGAISAPALITVTQYC